MDHNTFAYLSRRDLCELLQLKTGLPIGTLVGLTREQLMVRLISKDEPPISTNRDTKPH